MATIAGEGRARVVLDGEESVYDVGGLGWQQVIAPELTRIGDRTLVVDENLSKRLATELSYRGRDAPAVAARERFGTRLARVPTRG